MQTIVPLSPPSDGAALIGPIIFLAAAVIVVPIFRRLRLGSVVGYLAAGIAIGPQGFGLFNDPDAVLAFAELGVVMLLFIIGLELKPSRLWSMRRDILGFGLAQLALCGAAIAGIAHLAGLGWPGAVVAGAGLALSSTAFAAPLMEERGELTAPYGQRAFAILLMQDLAIVPLLALVALMAPGEKAPTGGIAQTLAILAGVAIVVLSARYLLNPFFRMLANARAREIMTAAALLVVLGAAFIMEVAGLSMAMGAFLAGVLLAESSFRHELEADIEPFRGLLLGLFFIAVGMGIDFRLVADNLAFVIAGVILLMTLKAALIYALARMSGSPHADALRIGGVLAQGGEFAFVLFGAAVTDGVMAAKYSNLLIATVTLSLALTPLVFSMANRAARPKPERGEPDGMPDLSAAKGKVIIIGFGRFGQVVAQFLMSQGIEVTAIDDNVEQIRAAAGFGFQVYYGDGTRLDVLRAAGAADASLIALCVVRDDVALRIVDLIQQHFPMAKLFVRSRDRRHTLDLMKRKVDYQIRETYESAVVFGVAALEALGLSHDAAATVETDMRRRDEERLTLQLAEGMMAGSHLMHTKPVMPEPLVEPKRQAKALNPEAEAVTRQEEPAPGVGD